MRLTAGVKGWALIIAIVIALILCFLSSSKPAISEAIAATVISISQVCYTCQIIKPLLTTISTAVDNLYAQVAPGLVALLMTLYTVWIAYFVMNVVGSMKNLNILDFWTTLIKKTVFVIMIALLISTSESIKDVFNTVIFPMVSGFVELGLIILNSSGTSITCGTALSEVPAGTSEMLEGLSVPITCLVEAIHKANSSGIVLGAKILSTPSVGIWTALVGMFILVFFVIFDLIFPLQLFDSLFRMGIMMMLFPIALMLSAFEVTRPILNRVFVYFVAVVVHIAVISVVFAVCLMVVQDVMREINPAFFVAANTVKLTDNTLKNISSLEMKELAMMAILIYMLFILNLFNEMVTMVAGIGVGSAMAKGVKLKGLKSGVGVGDASMKMAMGGAGIAKGMASKLGNKLRGG